MESKGRIHVCPVCSPLWKRWEVTFRCVRFLKSFDQNVLHDIACPHTPTRGWEDVNSHGVGRESIERDCTPNPGTSTHWGCKTKNQHIQKNKLLVCNWFAAHYVVQNSFFFLLPHRRLSAKNCFGGSPKQFCQTLYLRFSTITFGEIALVAKSVCPLNQNQKMKSSWQTTTKHGN